MSAPTARYATRLQSSISALTGSIIVENFDYLQGKSSGGTATAPITGGGGEFLRLLTPDTSGNGGYIAEVVEVTGPPVLVAGSIYTIPIGRTDGSFIGPVPGSVASGVWEPDVNGNVALTATPTVNYAFLAGATVENLALNAILADVSAGAATDQVVYNYDNGSIRFLNVGNTSAGTFAVDSGMTISVFGDYAAVSGNRVNIGKKQVNLEFQVELQHQMPDNRYFYFTAHKCAITPENTDFSFNPTDWIKSDLFLDALKSSNPAHAENPIGYFDVLNDPVTLLPVADETDEYSAGVYQMFLTPTNSTNAALRGLPTTRFHIGNVVTGNLRSPKQFLEHVIGIPQDLDKKILINRKFNMTSTIDQLNANNIALLFDGSITATQLGWRPFNKLVEVSADPPGVWGVTHVWHPLDYIKINIA